MNGEAEDVWEKLKRWLTILAFVVLGAALVSTFVRPGLDYTQQVREAVPEAERIEQVSSSPPVYEAWGTKEGETEESLLCYAAVGQGDGYGGPITTVTVIDPQGEIIRVKIADFKDTVSFIQKLKDAGFLEQFEGRQASESFELSEDVDAVSGATMSATGITRGVAAASHYVAREFVGSSVETAALQMKFGVKEALIVGLIALMLVGVKYNNRTVRWISLISSMFIAGFCYNLSLSLANVASILMGYLPPLTRTYWYIWYMGLPLLIILVGRNIYCFWLCPFGALQEIAAKIGGGGFSCERGLRKKARSIRYGLVFVALLLALVLRSPGVAAYEPFPTAFGLEGSGVQWFLLPAVVFAAFFITRFWCQYFCPGMVIIEMTLKVRRLGLRALEEVGKWTGMDLDIAR